jgi:hypothetical protein
MKYLIVGYKRQIEIFTERVKLLYSECLFSNCIDINQRVRMLNYFGAPIFFLNLGLSDSVIQASKPYDKVEQWTLSTPFFLSFFLFSVFFSVFTFGERLYITCSLGS